jgi:hypothetical protein
MRLRYHFSSYQIAVLTNLGVFLNVGNQTRAPNKSCVVSVTFLTKWRIPHVDIAIPEEILLRLFEIYNEIMFTEIFLTVCHGNKQASVGSQIRKAVSES